MNFKFKVEGIDRAKKILQNMSKAVNNKVMYDVNRAGGNIMKKALEQATPKGSGTKQKGERAAKNVIVSKSPTKTGIYVGYRRKTFWIVFLDQGTKKRVVKGRNQKFRGANRGRILQRPFIHRTYLRNAERVVKYLQDNYLKIVNRSIGKQLKRARR